MTSTPSLEPWTLWCEKGQQYQLCQNHWCLCSQLDQIILFFVRARITVWLTYCLTGLNWTKQANLLLMWLNLKNNTEGQAYSDPSSWKVSEYSLLQQQCDQIGQFIVLWATFQSLLQQLFCPNCPHIWGFFGIFVKVFNVSCEIIFGQLL